jgi:hypothetical protein
MDLDPHIVRKEVHMLERYFTKPQTADRIRGSWLGEAIERYVTWLADRGYQARSLYHRVPLLVRFAAFAHHRGATGVDALAGHANRQPPDGSTSLTFGIRFSSSCESSG